MSTLDRICNRHGGRPHGAGVGSAPVAAFGAHLQAQANLRVLIVSGCSHHKRLANDQAPRDRIELIVVLALGLTLLIHEAVTPAWLPTCPAPSTVAAILERECPPPMLRMVLGGVVLSLGWLAGRAMTYHLVKQGFPLSTLRDSLAGITSGHLLEHRTRGDAAVSAAAASAAATGR